MRIAYCTNLRLPSERAYGHQVAGVCNALVTLGHTVTVLHPRRNNPITESAQQYHGLLPAVTVETLPTFDGVGSAWMPGVLGLWSQNVSLRRALRRRLPGVGAELVYTRNPALLAMLLSVGLPVICELHTLPRWGRAGWVRLLSHCRTVVCLTTPMRDELRAWGVPADRMIIAPDAVDAARFASLPDAATARAMFGIPVGVPTVGYAGSIETMGLSKGVDLLVEAIVGLPGVHAVIAGGPVSGAAALRTLAQRLGVQDRVHLLGQVPPQDVATVYGASDVLVYTAPRSAHPYFLRDTSPLKLVEYMAAGKPIACADLPPVHDLLGADEAMLWTPGDAGGLRRALAFLFAQDAEARQMAAAARARAQNQSWEKRMERILAAG